MSKQAIVERIISDAEQEACAIVRAAEDRAKTTAAEAAERAERRRQGTQAEVLEKTKSIADGSAATARLDCAKILLSEKRKVIDEVYARALKQMLALGKEDSLLLAERLLEAYAEEGDEISFAENYRYAKEVAKLPVVAKRGLKVSPKTTDADGGFVLLGKHSDKNLSYGAILAADREERQAEIAAALFIER